MGALQSSFPCNAPRFLQGGCMASRHSKQQQQKVNPVLLATSAAVALVVVMVGCILLWRLILTKGGGEYEQL